MLSWFFLRIKIPYQHPPFCLLTHIFDWTRSFMSVLNHWNITRSFCSTMERKKIEFWIWSLLATGNPVQCVSHCFGSLTRICFTTLVLSRATLAWLAMFDECLLGFLKPGDCFPFCAALEEWVSPLNCSSRWTGSLFRKTQDGRDSIVFVTTFHLGSMLFFFQPVS